MTQHGPAMEPETGDADIEKMLRENLSAQSKQDEDRIPGRVDQAVSELIDEKCREIWSRKNATLFSRFAVWAASAAAVLLVLAAGSFLTTRQSGQPKLSESPERPSVADSSAAADRRAVDVVDAYLLASRIKAGRGTGRDDDINGDGAVNRADLDELMRKVVSVSTRT